MRLKQFYSNNRATIIITCIGILISPLVAILSEYFFSGITVLAPQKVGQDYS